MLITCTVHLLALIAEVRLFNLNPHGIGLECGSNGEKKDSSVLSVDTTNRFMTFCQLCNFIFSSLFLCCSHTLRGGDKMF